MTNNDKGVHPIYWVGGSKGGAGKSMMTIATVDYLLERGDKVLLVECDTSNADVGIVTNSPRPRRIQLTAVERGISSSRRRSGFPARMICFLMRWS
jgi:cellulose biosynthesis protein BcsQ